MKTIRPLLFGAIVIALNGCTTTPRKPAEETAKAEPLPVVDPFAPVTSETEKYWEKRNADDKAADEWERAQERTRGS